MQNIVKRDFGVFCNLCGYCTAVVRIFMGGYNCVLKAGGRGAYVCYNSIMVSALSSMYGNLQKKYLFLLKSHGCDSNPCIFH